MRVHDATVRIERVLSMPHDARLLIDEPPGEDLVVWALADQTDEDIAEAIDKYLPQGRSTRGGWTDEGSRFAS